MADHEKRRMLGNVAKLAVAVVLLAVAGVVLGRRVLSSDRQALTDPSAKIALACAKCGHQFEMLFSKYVKEAPQGTEIAGGLICPKCGAKAVQRVATPMPTKAGPLGATSSGPSEPERARPPARRAD